MLNVPDSDSVEGPSVRLGDGADLVRRFRQCDVERRFSLARAFKKEVEAECRLARSGVALYKIEPASRETAREYVIEAGNTRGNLWRRGCHTLESPAKPGPSGPVDYPPAEAQASTTEVGCPAKRMRDSEGEAYLPIAWRRRLGDLRRVRP